MIWAKLTYPDKKSSTKLSHLLSQNKLRAAPRLWRRGWQEGGLPPWCWVIAAHHEYRDGSGYPKKLKAEAIRMPTRIVTIANVYDNLAITLIPRSH